MKIISFILAAATGAMFLATAAHIAPRAWDQFGTSPGWATWAFLGTVTGAMRQAERCYEMIVGAA